MAGLYIHIPYCKSICNYCDFYKTANNRNIVQFVEALVIEFELKKKLISEKIETIYFGGGTPSLLSIQQLEFILKKLSQSFNISNVIELTIEINPDDISFEYLKSLRSVGFNRISIGIQSFDDKILKYLNRRHQSKLAIDSVLFAKNAGFENISVDLIYGIPGQSIDIFSNDLKIVNELEVQHLSAYHLGIEENSYFGKLKKAKRFIDISEKESEEMYHLLIDWSIKNQFEHYEISNFAKEGFYSKHNKSYWFALPYLGFGPSAHSFTKDKRIYNVNNVNEYIKRIENNQNLCIEETLSAIDKFNEYIMLGLRTKWGINLLEMKAMIEEKYLNKIVRSILLYAESDYLRIENDTIKLTEKGYLISDSIIRNLFIAE